MKPRSRTLVACCLLAVAAAPAPPPGFTVAQVHVGGSLQRLEAGDLDGDGDPDLLVLGAAQGAIPLTVLVNGPGASFAPGWSASLGGQPADTSDLDLADLDLDGDLDALASMPHTVQSRLNAGDASFDAFVTLPAGSPRVQNELGLLDGDAIPDIAAYDVDVVGHVGGHRGAGDGSFVEQNAHPIGGGDFAARTDLGDVTGDGLLDLVRADQAGVHYTPATPGPFPGWGTDVLVWFDAAADIELADLDSDGLLDALASIPLAGAIERFPGLPGGGLLAVAPYPAGLSPGPIALADMDNDGDLDVAIVNQAGRTISINANDGAGVFLDLKAYRGGRLLTDIVAADFDADGDADLAAASDVGRVSIFFNQLVP